MKKIVILRKFWGKYRFFPRFSHNFSQCMDLNFNNGFSLTV